MADDAILYRERAEAERGIADETILPNVRNRALQSAKRWDELADQIERAKARAAARQSQVADLPLAPQATS
ncbi:MAG: hypothetical protein EOO77_11130 [Oxalobacteraceae bacterium]|nr:MAG: hypothetical protein EOO77_11130 [Oxalobacteraceae bacterium]